MLNTKEEIEAWLIEMGIKNYTINDDLTVNTRTGVDLRNKGLTEIPIQFNRVGYHFDCSHNELTSLNGCPRKVVGCFYCNHNKLTNLEGCPVELVGHLFGGSSDFNCSYNKLTSLKGCIEIIDGDFWCEGNEIDDFKYLPKEINGKFHAKYAETFEEAQYLQQIALDEEVLTKMVSNIVEPTKRKKSQPV